MKCKKTVLALISTFLLASCATLNIEGVNTTTRSGHPIESSSLPGSINPASSSITQIAADMDIMYEFGHPTIGNDTEFVLPTIPWKNCRLSMGDNTLEAVNLYIDGVLIEEGIDTLIGVFASDINGDGYNDFVYAKDEGGVDIFTVYDVANGKRIFALDTGSKQIGEINPHFTYQYTLLLHKNRLVFAAWNDSRSTVYYDYAYFEYSRERGVYLEFQNMYDIEKISFVALLGPDGRAADVDDAHGAVYYLLEPGLKYTLQFMIERKDDYDETKILPGWSEKDGVLPTGGIQVVANEAFVIPEHVAISQVQAPRDGGNFGLYSVDFAIDSPEDMGTFHIGYCTHDLSINVRGYVY